MYLVEVLEEAGHAASHVRELDMSEALEDEVLTETRRHGAVLIASSSAEDATRSLPE
jgi:predicted nuclease of predicted toxin-antitoxin system